MAKFTAIVERTQRTDLSKQKGATPTLAPGTHLVSANPAVQLSAYCNKSAHLASSDVKNETQTSRTITLAHPC